MINKIINAISNAIYPNFGNDYEIYTEQVDQDLKEPCFLIQHVESSLRPIIPPRYYFKNKLSIKFTLKQTRKMR